MDVPCAGLAVLLRFDKTRPQYPDSCTNREVPTERRPLQEANHELPIVKFG